MSVKHNGKSLLESSDGRFLTVGYSHVDSANLIADGYLREIPHVTSSSDPLLFKSTQMKCYHMETNEAQTQLSLFG